jgi:diacylglycerol O-acyltransferase
MATQIPNERVPSEDAMWLYLEKPEMPLHVACTCTFDGPISLSRLRAHIQSKLPLIPRYLQRAVFPPLNISHPTWELDAGFDIRHHIHHTVLKNGTKEELEDFVAKNLTEIMDRSRPLWDMTLVDGMEGGGSALIVRAHHALVDGIAGVALMNVLFDKTRKPSAAPKGHARFEAEPARDPTTRMLSALLNSYAEMSGKWLSAQSAALDLAGVMLGNSPVSSVEQLLRLVPEFAAPVELLYERLPFNKPVLGPRKIAWTELPLDEVKAVKNKIGGKLNDVALTVMTVAVRRYAKLHGEDLHAGRLLRYFVPVNIRRQDDVSYGNNISLLPVNVPLDIAGPVELYRAISAKTEALKRAHVAEIISLIGRCLGATPAPVQMALGLLGNNLPVPPFNMVFTNIPGPDYPLYLLGREMLTYYPYVPIGTLMACNVAIESYNGNLYFGLAGDAEAIPDLRLLRDYVDDAFAQLKKKAGVSAARKPAKTRKRTVPETQTVAAVAAEPDLKAQVAAAS